MLEFKAPAAVSVDSLQGTLVSALTAIAEPPSTVRRCFFDSFDWRLWRFGFQLELARCAHHMELILSSKYGTLSLAHPSVPRFATELRDGPLRAQLTKLLDVRALLPRVTMRTRRRRFRVENKDGKTVFGIQVDENRVINRGPGAVRVTALPVRGYAKFEKRCLTILNDQLGLQRLEECVYLEGLRHLKLHPHSPAKKHTAMQPSQRVDSAYKVALRTYYDELERNVPGILEDIDTECLHDFRVALRKARTTLRQCHGVFPSRVLGRLRSELAWLTAQTGELRDLDVHLLAIEAYQAGVEETDRDALTALREHVVSRRATFLKRLNATLRSPRFVRLMTAWRTFLERRVPARSVLPYATRPVELHARQRIWKAYKRVRRIGRLAQDTDDSRVRHNLRVACKTLRYLIELHAPLFAKQQVRGSIASLKRLQEVLGSLQDVDVQTDVLFEFGRQPACESTKTPNSKRTVDELVNSLHKRADDAHTQFDAAFAEFECKTNRRRLRVAFKPRREA